MRTLHPMEPLVSDALQHIASVERYAAWLRRAATHEATTDEQLRMIAKDADSAAATLGATCGVLYQQAQGVARASGEAE